MKKIKNRVSQEQFYDLLVSKELSWQAIIYDLIRTEQLDPWDIDLALVARKYIERIQQLQELGEGTFFISSKVLLAGAIMLKIKAELLHNNMQDIDEMLFDKNKKTTGIELVNPSQLVDFAEEESVILPRTPLPRGRKVTLHELMAALDRAINTEHRRIKKELAFRRIRSDIDFVLPHKTINIGQKIRELYCKIKDFFLKHEKLTYTKLVGTSRDERIACFLPLLHLDSQKKIVLQQEMPFSEIEIWLREKGPKLEEEKLPED